MASQQINENIKPILEKVKQGEKQAYALIIEQFQKPIFLYCYYMLRNQQEAEDTAQETFLKAYKYLDRFAYTHSFSSWLYKIAQNCCMDVLKKRKKDSQLLSLYQTEQSGQSERSTANDVYECLDMLTEEEKQIILLRSLEEYSYDEIAYILNIRAATVRKRYERIKKKLIQQKKQGVNIYEHSY
ncbi:RNA polymerase sigma factor [Paenibacillus campi]|uniref:RNA polymerase sigma factor n=1 Tax=Paenibacillus campi TaxID=3106031 RepID=UPI002AFF0A55|nr:sigma-70 family RNA polymerase sigma factor [Paenibacillus sp. SGZ-1014]